MKWYLWGAVVLLYSLFGSACSTERRYDLSAYGLSPVEHVDNAPAMARALEQIREKCEENQTIVVTLPKGRYEFYPDSAAERVYFISNHDQMNPKKVGLPFEGMKNMVFDGQGSELIFHGRMLPGFEELCLEEFQYRLQASSDFTGKSGGERYAERRDHLRGGSMGTL